jgi:hypothetical protein
MDQFGIVCGDSAIGEMNYVLKSNPGRNAEAPSLANAGPSAAAFAMQQNWQHTLGPIEYRDDLVRFFQCFPTGIAGHFDQNSQAFFKPYIGHKSSSVLAAP